MPHLQGFHYLTSPAADDRPPLLLLHGSSRDETELLPLADAAAPDWPYLSLRGGIPWYGGHAFFRRKPDRSLDRADLAHQTECLRDFIHAAVETGLIARPPIVLGFSNGAIIASALLIRDPTCTAGAILIRPLSPDRDADVPPMPGKPILVLSGDHDDRRVPEDATHIAAQFEHAGAAVVSHISPTDHHLHPSEAKIIAGWLETTFFTLVANDHHR
jgi:phospholipase/carboxylesterase